MKLNILLLCLFSGLTTILAAPEMEKKAATNSLDTSPATKGNGDVLADACYYCVGVCRGYYCCDPRPNCFYASGGCWCSA
ncbi:hypothetical protein BDDG_01029 [Blastomyces dermatitidis ATCC 18188]|uniref:Uncharacterized protein n=1 Tax=Ajellomyces dermatitidis (strain ATCC 18188 / CBS 674.68) TaxID=653446 RepID=F2T3U0_AJEDA|nr:hypothetical protein BDDG_01029 [Blastomyces dermatitidis ATCC 18188]EQL29959.1 hypothetical protein BDFG_07516 [Blastomyces dermatitidis ATCC 26199]